MSDKVKNKLTSYEKKWILYDVANSAFVLLATTLIPIFFNMVAAGAGLPSDKYLAYWGYTQSVATILSALIGPIFGAFSDRKDRKKTMFLITVAVGSFGSLFFGFARQWLAFLILFVLGRVAFNLSLVIYDSMLPDVTTEERMDDVSSQGYAWGYIGSVIPFIISLALYVLSNQGVWALSEMNAMTIGFALTGLWWFFVSLPLIKSYKQTHYISEEEAKKRNAFKELGLSIKHAATDKKVGLFLLAFFFYIDGVYTIIDMATAYGTSLGLDTVGLLAALLVTQVVAFPSALIIGRLSRKFEAKSIIMVCIVAYFFICVYGLFLDALYKFWILAVVVGMFQGGIQAMSRSYFTKIIPAEKSGEYFGLYDIIGKGAAFLGTALMGFVTDITGKANYGVGAITIFFLVGGLLFWLSTREHNATPTEPVDAEEAFQN
ncbi:MAG: MFS transporter [Clostridia bacterium]|nr:MFS transporter [Clostridia bacterium]